MREPQWSAAVAVSMPTNRSGHPRKDSLSMRRSPVPEVTLTLEWPDGRTSALYSPSTVIFRYLRPGASLPVGELEHRVAEALRHASERVRARYGFACTRTEEEERKLRQIATAYAADQIVQVVG